MKKKGFTLIELLAVIVILAVIALIATPMILNLIEKTKMSAAIESVNGIIDSAEKNKVASLINGTNTNYYDLTADTLEYKGDKPEKGELFIDDKGNTKVIAEVNNYCVTKGYGDIEPYIVDTTNCELYKEEILNGTDPILKEGLIPITIANNGTVTYANITEKWYSYTDKEWANAVILVDNPSKTYSVGDIILEDDIESYFVWIPKYSYKLWNLGKYSDISNNDTSKVHAIDIRFGLENTSDANNDECTTPLKSGESGNCEVNDYMTHPAFITMNTTGLWVGKFETGYKGATSTSAAQVNSADATKIIVKPNSYSWRNNTVSNIYSLSLAYNANLESHMMKNTEWGAVAYLSHSKYGINKEITINNCARYVTGIGGDSVSNAGSSTSCTTVQNMWNGAKGKLASTTGNITGIYDMSGGVNEYMASYISGQTGNSYFDTLTINKYVDIYKNSGNYSNYTGRILGDATGEMGPFSTSFTGSWYDDGSYFAVSSTPWFCRSGFPDNATRSGVFHFMGIPDGINNGLGFRLVLAP